LVPEEIRSCRVPTSKDYQTKFRLTEKLLQEFVSLGNDKNVPVVFVLAPSIIQAEDDIWKTFLTTYNASEKDYSRTVSNERLLQFSEEHELMMLDLFPALTSESKRNLKLYHEVEQHWTRAGNQVVASELVKFLRAKSLIED
jgi:hypothetical protein